MEEDIQEQEIQHQQSLRTARAAAQKQAVNLKNSEVVGRLSALAANKNKTAIFIIGLILKGMSDIADWFGVPAIPLVGDMLDLATGGISVMLSLSLKGNLKNKSLLRGLGAMLFELLPFGINDLVPTYVLENLWTWHTANKTVHRCTATHARTIYASVNEYTSNQQHWLSP